MALLSAHPAGASRSLDFENNGEKPLVTSIAKLPEPFSVCESVSPQFLLGGGDVQALLVTLQKGVSIHFDLLLRGKAFSTSGDL